MNKIYPASFTVYSPVSSTLSPKQTQTQIPFKEEYDKYTFVLCGKDAQARKYYKENILPKTQNSSLIIDDLTSKALDLYFAGKDSNFKTHFNPTTQTLFEFETIKKGFKKAVIIRTYKNNSLMSQIEVNPKNYVKIKNFKDSISQYDYYENNFKTGKRLFKKNVKENISDNILKQTADEIHEFHWLNLQKYEEGYESIKRGKEGSHTIKRRFVPYLNSHIIEYTYGISKSSAFRRENSRFNGSFDTSIM